MKSEFVRKSIYLAVCTLLLIVSAALIANFNVQAAHAQTSEGGGGEANFHDLISGQILARHTFTIYTTTTINNVGTYIVHPQRNIDYFTYKFGTDYICVIAAADARQTQVCIPFSAIAGVTYR